MTCLLGDTASDAGWIICDGRNWANCFANLQSVALGFAQMIVRMVRKCWIVI